MDRLRLKNDAKTDISGRLFQAWQPLILLLAIYIFLSVFISVGQNSANKGVHIAFTVIYSLFSLTMFVISMPLQTGGARYYLGYVARRNPDWTCIFDEFKKPRAFFEEFKAYALIVLIVVAGTICLIIPGIYFALLYSQVSLIFAENDDLSWKDAMKRSRELMTGHVFEMFILYLSFFFWMLFVAITFGFGIIYVGPYMICTFVRYYKSLCFIADSSARYTTAATGEGIDGIVDDAPFDL